MPSHPSPQSNLSCSIISLSPFGPPCSIHPYLKIPPHGLILTSRGLWVFQMKYCLGNNQLLKQVHVNMEWIQRRKGLCKSLTPGRSRWLWVLHCEWAWVVSRWTLWENQGVWVEKGHPRAFMKHVLSYQWTFTAMESGKFKFDYTKKCYFKRNLSTRHRGFTDYLNSYQVEYKVSSLPSIK